MNKSITAKNAKELGDLLGLTESESIEIEFRVELNEKIIEIVQQKKLTHAVVAKYARTSRTRITAMLNRNIDDISTDLMLRVLGALGYKASLKVTRVA